VDQICAAANDTRQLVET